MPSDCAIMTDAVWVVMLLAACMMQFGGHAVYSVIMLLHGYGIPIYNSVYMKGW